MIGSTSFFPAKPLGCYGDGGALFTNDDALATAMRAIRTHGGERRHHHTYVGTNGRFDTLQAAIILGKWPGFPAEVQKREELGRRYTDLLATYVDVPEISSGNTHVFAQFTIRVKEDGQKKYNGATGANDTGNARDQLQEHLNREGIPTGIYYPKCFHEQPVFQTLGYRYGDFPESERASREVLSLPMSPFLTETDQNRVIDAVRSWIEK